MNYSVFYPSILFMYFGTFVGVLATIVLLICGDLFLLKQYLKSKFITELIGFVFCIVAIITVAIFSQNFFKDIPNVVNKNYIVTTGTAEGWDSAGQIHETRGFAFKKDNGEIKNIIVTYTPIYQGDRFEVIYLPNTGFGAIVKEFEGGELP